MEAHQFDPSKFAGLIARPVVEARLDSEAQTRAFGAWLAERVVDGDVIGLVGNLGAGKTTLTQGLVEALLDEEATSPTYTLLNLYEGKTEVYHFDLYRLSDINDLETVGYWDYVESGFGVSLIEWIDRIPGAWPGHGVIVQLEHLSGARRLRLWTTDGFAERFEGALPWPNI